MQEYTIITMRDRLSAVNAHIDAFKLRLQVDMIALQTLILQVWTDMETTLAALVAFLIDCTPSAGGGFT